MGGSNGGGFNRWIPTGIETYWADGSNIISPYKKYKNEKELKKELTKASKFSGKEKVKITDQILIQMIKELVVSDKDDVTINDALEPVKALMLLKYGDDFSKKYEEKKQEIIASRVDIVYQKNRLAQEKANRASQRIHQDAFETAPDYLDVFLKVWVVLATVVMIYLTALLIQQNVFPSSAEQSGLQMPVHGTANTRMLNS